jgi:transcriptional regulator with XRE-family HTH domain
MVRLRAEDRELDGAGSFICKQGGTSPSRYERGISRPTADTLKRLADALGVSGDYLLEGASDEAAKARFEDRELLRRFQEVQELSSRDKEIVKELLDAFLTRKQIQRLAG